MYIAFQGWPTDSSLLGPAVTPCNWADFKAGLSDGEGYFFDGLTTGAGSCRKLANDKITAIKEARSTSGQWTSPTVTAGTCYLPVTESDFNSDCPSEYPHKVSTGAHADKLCAATSTTAGQGSESDLSKYCVLFPFIMDLAYRTMLQELRTTVCGDSGASARCSNVLEGRPGVLDCQPSASSCSLGGAHHTDSWCWTANCADRCKTVFASPVSCPDGIGPRGVFVSFDSPGPDFCASWDSGFTVVGSLGCRIAMDGRTMCTKYRAQHVHWMSTSAGMLSVKRVHCQTSRGKCFVHKVARCIDVGEAVFGSKYNNVNPNLRAETETFGTKALEAMKAHAGACSAEDERWVQRALQAW